MMSIRVGRIALPSLLLTLLATGCSKENPNAPATVSGKVTYNGAPVSAGMIIFHTETGEHGVSLNPDGTYTGTDLPIGDATVTIETESANPDRKKEAYKGGDGGLAAKYKGAGGGTPGKANDDGRESETSPMPDYAKNAPRGAYVKIPAHYADREKSTFKVTLKRGDNKNDYKLTD